MSNRPLGVGKFGAPPQARPVAVELDKLVSFHCPSCNAPAFTSVWQLREVPALLSNNPVGGPQLIRIESWMCIGCGAVWMLDQLKKLTKDQRESVRVHEEIRHEVRGEILTDRNQPQEEVLREREARNEVNRGSLGDK